MIAFRRAGCGIVSVLAVALVACGGREGSQQDSTAADSAMMGMPGMDSMRGMAGMMSDSMMTAMHSHMQMMDTVSAAQLQSMFGMHGRSLSDMMSRMDNSMRAMNMPPDAAWTATQDSLRQDLTRMQAMTPDELKRVLPAHHARVMRLMDMHRRMMGRG